MKKIAILTFNQAINYGAVFQMYALEHFINTNFSVECEVLNYQSPKLAKVYDNKRLRDFLSIRGIYHLFIRNDFIRFNKSAFQEFIKKNVKITKRAFTSNEALESIENEYDLFIVGSDQVFNPFCNQFDFNYYLEFISNNLKKCSYAASVGFADIPESVMSILQEKVSCFHTLSIREQSSIDSMSKMLNKPIERNIDPVFLLPPDKWKELSSASDNGEYVLVYALSQDQNLIRYARHLGHLYRCKVLYVNDRYMNPIGMNSLKNTSPSQWLSLLINAKAVVTNSFHGISFSLIFNKELHPFLLDKNTRVNTRITDLLELFGIDYKPGIIINDDWEHVNKIIEREQNKSLEYLSRVIED